MKRFQGIGGILKDDVKYIHQMAARIETPLSQDRSHSELSRIKLSQKNTNRAFKNRNPEAICMRTVGHEC
jgi:hypothetical protein